MWSWIEATAQQLIGYGIYFGLTFMGCYVLYVIYIVIKAIFEGRD